LGHSTPDRVFVDFAVPYQTATRKFREVHIDWKRSARVEEAVRGTSRWELVGDYHSHAMYGPARASTELSTEDQEFFADGTVGIVVAINDIRRPKRWAYSPGGIISGAVNGYSIRIAAYAKRNSQIDKAPIICPYAVGFMGKRRVSARAG
ncbi:MAG TPA: hypothetical protein VFV36_09425, partial [Candidatus Methylomirabilis sp.]|nr:hypothetical protein [Candidatus Methylomirabilis sp.]